MKLRFLIRTQELKQIGFTNTNVNDNVVSTTLLRVQDTMLRPVIGSELFKRLLDGVENNNLNSDEIGLLDEYIKPYLISAVDWRITNHTLFEIRAKTTGKAQDVSIQPVSESELVRLQDHLRRDIETYKQMLIGYLADNCDVFPEYKSFMCSYEAVKPENPNRNSSAISFI